MSMLALEGCLLLGLLASFGVVAVLVRHLDAPLRDPAGGRRADDRCVSSFARRGLSAQTTSLR